MSKQKPRVAAGGFSVIETLLVLTLFALIAGMGRALFFPSRQDLDAATRIAKAMIRTARAEAILRNQKTRLIICKQTNESIPESLDYRLRFLGIIAKEENDTALQASTWSAIHKGAFLPADVYFEPKQSYQGLSTSNRPPSMAIPYPARTPVIEGLPNSFQWYYYTFNANGELESGENMYFVLSQKIKTEEALGAHEANKTRLFINRRGRVFTVNDFPK